MINQLGRKISLTQGIETREAKSRSEYSLILTPNLFIAIIAPLNVYEAECKQFGVRIAVNDYFETSNLPRPPLIYLLQFNGTYNLLLTYILTLIDNNTKE